MRDKEQLRPRVGVAVVVWDDGKVLLGKRKGSHGADHWATPGGHLEFGETVENCACRELLEETGIVAHSIKRGPYTSDDSRHYITLFVIVNQFEGVPKTMEPHKCEAWTWFAPDDLPSPLFVPLRSFISVFSPLKVATK
jgi:8-oxo-dGTP diphosphatase